MRDLRRKTVLVATATAVALIASVSAGAPVPAGAREGAAARVEYRSCPADVTMKGVRCGRLRVPLERADPALGTIPIAFAVRPPSDRHKPPRGTVFAVEGGPGYGSINSIRYYADMLGPRLRQRYRLVTVDMRGTGHSQAIDCPGLQRARVTDGRGVARCARRLGRTFASYRTSAAADDLDAVRAALGVRRITMYGDSYGTYLAQSYAYRHGEHLKALVLDSAFPVRGESPWYPSVVRRGVRSLGIVCRRSTRCSPGARRRLGAVVRSLRRSGRRAGPLLDAIGSAGYTPAPPGYLRIDRAVSAYLRGDRRPYDRLVGGGPPVYGNPRVYSRGQELAVSCNDYPMLWDKRAGGGERRRQLHAAIRRKPARAFAPFSPAEVALEAFSSYHECLRWPRPTGLYEPPAPRGAEAPDVPVLVMDGELDNVTSPGEAAKVAAAFPDARRVIVRNAGHVPSLYGARFPGAERRVRGFIARWGG